MKLQQEVLDVLTGYHIFEANAVRKNGQTAYVSGEFLIIFSSDMPEPMQKGFLYSINCDSDIEYRDSNITIYWIPEETSLKLEESISFTPETEEIELITADGNNILSEVFNNIPI